MRNYRWLAWFVFVLLAIATPISCSNPTDLGQGGGGEQNVLAPTVTGNMICFPLPACDPIVIVVTATQSAAWTQTPTLTAVPTSTAQPSATRTPTIAPTPSKVTVTSEVTAISNPEICLVEPYSERVKGTYEYKDFPNYGVGQNIRTGPGVNYPIVTSLPKTLPKNSPVTIFWIKWVSSARWVALNNECSRWVNGELGILDFD